MECRDRGKSAFQFFIKSLFLPWLSIANERSAIVRKTKANVSKKSTQGSQKIGQACGWQVVDKNRRDVSREEITEARDQQERCKPTCGKYRQRFKTAIIDVVEELIPGVMCVMRDRVEP